MKLTQTQKDDLEMLMRHQGWKVLELIHEECEKQLWTKLASANLSDEADLDVIRKNQIYSEARKQFFRDTEKHVQNVFVPEEVS